MKLLKHSLLSIAILILSTLSSCSDDDDLQLTGINGKPSYIECKNDFSSVTPVYFSYQGDKLVQLKEIEGSIFEFKYEENKLVSVYISPESKDVADGHGSISFKHEENNKIIIESTGEPFFYISRWTLELNEKGVPSKISEDGIFSHTGANGEVTKTSEGQYYATFNYDQASRLLKLIVSEKNTEETVITYKYEYDNNTGSISKLNLPLWYYAYTAYRDRKSSNPYEKFFLNYINNIQKETFITKDTNEESFKNYTYEYNKDKTPTLMGCDAYGLSYLTISY